MECAPVTVADAARAVEIVSLGGGGVLPIVALDCSAVAGAAGTGGGAFPVGSGAVPVGSGTPGPFFKALEGLMHADLAQSAFLDDIPYAAYPRAAP